MNTLKNVLFFGLLAAVLCGVYLSLNRAPEAPLPPGLSGDTNPLKVAGREMPGTQISSLPPGQPGNSPPSLPAQPPLLSAPPLGPPPTVAASGGSLGASALQPPAAPVAPVRNAFDSAHPGGPEFISPRQDPPPAAAAQPDHSASAIIEQTLQEVKIDVEKGQFDKALVNLSLLYGRPELPPVQAREITKILDQMAAKVIYSREHLLEDPYLVRPGESLEAIADHCKVPAMLLAKINGISESQVLPPGRSLKLVRGPFSAQISTDRSEMTLMLNGRYAGRFSVLLSNDLSRADGLWSVRQKHEATNAVGGAAGTPWIELGNSTGTISMQATNDTGVAAVRDGNNSRTIWLNVHDMDDVFAILSASSMVIIKR
jgi:hypothetical protein